MMTRIHSTTLQYLFVALLACGTAACMSADEQREAQLMQTTLLLDQLQSEDLEVKAEAVDLASSLGPAAVEPAGWLLTSEDRATELYAKRALWTVVHHSTRPGMRHDRRAVSGKLLKLLTTEDAPAEIPVSGRREILQMLALTVNDAEDVRGVAAFLDDEELAGAALFSLQRISHPEADAVLIERLSGDSNLPRSAFARALGQRRCRAAAGDLRTMAKEGEADEAAAARHALALIGHPGSLDTLKAAFAAGQPSAADDLLLYADVRHEDGDRDTAIAVYESLLPGAAPQLRAAAVRGLGAAGGVDQFPVLIGSLGDKDPSVRAEALNAIVALEADIDTRLANVYASADPTRRAAVLRARVMRNPEAGPDLVEEALRDGAPEVRIAALELAGAMDAAGLEPLLLAAAASETAAPGEADAALESYLDHARMRLQKSDKAAALEMYHRVLESTESSRLLSRTLTGVAAIGSPESLPRIEPLRTEADLVEPVDRARIAIAGGMAATEKEAAVEILESICTTSSSRSLRAAAQTQLKDLGVDTAGFALKSGFLVKWHLIGPFPKAEEDDFGTQPFGESNIDLQKAVAIEGGELAWMEHATEDLDGMVNLLKVGFETTQNVCGYAFTVVDRPAGGDAMLKIGSDDGVAVWVNGKLVHENFTARGAIVDEDKVPVSLRAGANSILVKVSQGGGDWRFCVRLAGADGKPIDLTAPGG